MADNRLEHAQDHIEFLNRQLDDLERRYHDLSVEVFKYRNEAKKYEYAIRDHKLLCETYPDSLETANHFLWDKL